MEDYRALHYERKSRRKSQQPEAMEQLCHGEDWLTITNERRAQIPTQQIPITSSPRGGRVSAGDRCGVCISNNLRRDMTAETDWTGWTIVRRGGNESPSGKRAQMGQSTVLKKCYRPCLGKNKLFHNSSINTACSVCHPLEVSLHPQRDSCSFGTETIFSPLRERKNGRTMSN